ncbi:MAG: hypothetical protein ABIQ89_02815 [Candidatus Saccharimonadales bacterium]
MKIICPCITAVGLQQFNQQVNRVKPFAKRLHVDFMDGHLTSNTSPDLDEVSLPDDVKLDLHLMYKNPTRHMRAIVKLKPHLVIVHAEAEGDFITFAKILHRVGIKVGVALLPETAAISIKPALEHIDHVMIFSGKLGKFGGEADLDLLVKAQALKHIKSSLEIGWDGGVNDQNVHLLAAGGIDVLNVGGAIQKADDPAKAYATLKAKLR